MAARRRRVEVHVLRAPADPTVRYVHQILLWPLELMPAVLDEHGPMPWQRLVDDRDGTWREVERLTTREKLAAFTAIWRRPRSVD
jgi:hypothetical protein